MGNTKFFFSFFIVAAILSVISCNRPQPCSLKHYVESDNCRLARDFSADTMSLEALVWKYFELVDGDTIVVKGYLNPYRYSAEIPLGCYGGENFRDNKYLCDNPPEADTINYQDLYERTLDSRFMSFYQGQYGYGWVLFFDRLHLFVIPDSSLWAYTDTSKLIVRGIFHLQYLEDEVNGCAENCVLDPFEFSPYIVKK